MTVTTKLRVIDADAHVVETDKTWDYLEPSEEKFRPRLFSSPADPNRQVWVIDGKIRGNRPPTLTEMQLAELSKRQGRNMETPQQAREMDDIELRLNHMDQLGVDIQVLHTTLWIEQVTERIEVEVALCGSWNRWLAEIWKRANGRLRWTCVLPLMSIPQAIEQMRFAKQHGAVGCFMRTIEGNRLLVDPYFYPVYDEAMRLDMPVIVHVSNGNAAMCDFFRTPYVRSVGFWPFRTPTMATCHAVLMSEIPDVFPRLRWGFVEASAQWVPWVLHEVARRDRGTGRSSQRQEILRNARVYVTCETDDDLPYILEQAGDDNLVTGTDYGHADTSSQVDAIKVLQARGVISQQSMEKILSHNPAALYAL